MNLTIIDHASPNFNSRPANGEIDAVIVHGTAGASVQGDLEWLCDESIGANGEPTDTSASYHYLIGRDGTLYQLVDESDRAWHAGVSEWNGRRDLNSWSIGVGLTNRGPIDHDANKGGLEDFTSDQILVAANLVVDICHRHNIPWHHILTHAQVSPGRKTDPWLHFPMGAFAGALLTYQTLRAGGG